MTEKINLYEKENGEPVKGFARDFLQESLKANFRAPLTQAVISLAVGKVITEYLLNKRGAEIIEFIFTLSKQINIDSVVKTVKSHYRRNGYIGSEKLTKEALKGLFIYEISTACLKIALIAKSLDIESNTYYEILKSIKSFRADSPTCAAQCITYLKRVSISRVCILDDFLEAIFPLVVQSPIVKSKIEIIKTAAKDPQTFRIECQAYDQSMQELVRKIIFNQIDSVLSNSKNTS